MQYVRHIAQNAGYITQNNGCTRQNVGCNMLNVCQEPKGPTLILEKTLVSRNDFRTLGTKK